ncbi:MAG: hypothetical protein V1754_01205, partial [Pseudomonadota bacterium]
MSPLTAPRARVFSALSSLAVVATDMLSVILGFFAAVYLYQKGHLAGFWLRGRHDPTIYGYVIMGCCLVLVFAGSFYKAYQRDSSILNIQEWMGTLKAFILLVAITFAATFTVREMPISRIVLGLGLGLAGIQIIFYRFLHRRVLMGLFRRGFGVSSVVIYGDGDPARTLARRMEESPRL